MGDLNSERAGCRAPSPPATASRRSPRWCRPPRSCATRSTCARSPAGGGRFTVDARPLRRAARPPGRQGGGRGEGRVRGALISGEPTREEVAELFERRRQAWLTGDLDGYLVCWTDDMVLRTPDALGALAGQGRLRRGRPPRVRHRPTQPPRLPPPRRRRRHRAVRVQQRGRARRHASSAGTAWAAACCATASSRSGGSTGTRPTSSGNGAQAQPAPRQASTRAAA